MLVAPTLFGLTHDDVAEERAKMEEKMGSAAGGESYIPPSEYHTLVICLLQQPHALQTSPRPPRSR